MKFKAEVVISAMLLLLANDGVAQQPKKSIRPIGPIIGPGDGVGGSEYEQRPASAASARTPTFTIRPESVGGTAPQPARPDIIGPGLGVGAAPPRTLIIVPGTGVGSDGGIIVIPGTGVAAPRVLPDGGFEPSRVIYPGTGIGSLQPRPDGVTVPGTGVGGSSPTSASVLVPASGLGSAQPPVIVSGTGNGWFQPPPAPVVVPGTGVGSIQPAPAPIIVPGTAVGSVPTRPEIIVVPGTGVAGSSPPTSASIIVPGTGVAAARPPVVMPGIAVPGIAVPVTGAETLQLAPTELPWTPAASPYVLSDGVEPLSFGDLDSGLRDCDIAFDQLKDKSPFCKGPQKDGILCQRFSYNQFPEVVLVRVRYPDESEQICTGTMISPEWAITAAHCFVDQTPTQSFSGAKDKDYVWTPSTGAANFRAAWVEAHNAKLLPRDQRRRAASQVTVYGKYSGHQGNEGLSDDLALIRIAPPFNSQVMQPARIATKFAEAATLAGYGYSNVEGGTIGRFQLTWPKPIEKQQGRLSFKFKDDDEVRSGFCQGDSGGPVFAERVRGCKPYDVAAEARPRQLQGAISYNPLGVPTGDTETALAVSACMGASEMVMQDLTLPERRKWICRVTRNGAAGCPR